MTLEGSVADTTSNTGEATLSTTTGSKLRVEMQKLIATGHERTYWGGLDVVDQFLDILVALTSDEADGIDIDAELRQVVAAHRPEAV